MEEYLELPTICLMCMFCEKFMICTMKECLVYCYYPCCYSEKCIPCIGYRGANDETK